MKHPERVEDYLGHIVEAIECAISYLQALPDFAARAVGTIVALTHWAKASVPS